MVKPIKTAVFPVAGLGTRFLPATKAIPKEMLTVYEKPLIQHAVEEAKISGVERFIFITSHGKEAIEDHFDANPLLENVLKERGKIKELENLRALSLLPGEAIFIRQQQPLGLGHAVWCARHLIGDDPFALILADDMILSNPTCLSQMIEAYHRKGGGNFAAVMEVEPDHVNRYGILDIICEENDIIEACGVVEKPLPSQSPSCTAIVGRYILEASILNHLAVLKPGIGGEIQLTDAFSPLMSYSKFYGYRFKGTRFDCGTKEGWLEANLAFAYNHPELREHLIKSIKKHCYI